MGSTTPTTDSIGQIDTQPDPQPTLLNQINSVGGEASAEDGNQVHAVFFLRM